VPYTARKHLFVFIVLGLKHASVVFVSRFVVWWTVCRTVCISCIYSLFILIDSTWLVALLSSDDVFLLAPMSWLEARPPS